MKRRRTDSLSDRKSARSARSARSAARKDRKAEIPKMPPGLIDQAFLASPGLNGDAMDQDSAVVEEERKNHVIVVGAGPAGLMLA